MQCFSLDGKERWRNQDMKQVPRVAVVRNAAGEPIVLCTNERGRMMSLDAKGKRLEDLGSDQAFIWVTAADLDGDQRPKACGIFMVPNSTNRVAVAMGPQGEEKKSYTLPTGNLPGWIEPIVAGHLAAGGPGCWFLPATDGSIHILAADGQLIDKFNFGATLTGLATLVLDGRPVLVVASRPGPGGIPGPGARLAVKMTQPRGLAKTGPGWYLGQAIGHLAGGRRLCFSITSWRTTGSVMLKHNLRL